MHRVYRESGYRTNRRACESFQDRLPRALFLDHHSPTIVGLVTHRFLSARWDLHKELHCAAIELFKGIRVFDDVPTRPAIEMLNDTHFDGIALVIAHLDFTRFRKPPRIDIC